MSAFNGVLNKRQMLVALILLVLREGILQYVV